MIYVFHRYYDADNAQYVVGTYRSTENAYVDNVKLCGTLNSQDPRRACITFRIPVSIIMIYIYIYICVYFFKFMYVCKIK